MTIREHFQEVSKRIQHWATGVAIVLVCFLTWLYPNLSPLHRLGGGILLGIALCPVLLVVIRRRFLCPRCGADLAKLHRGEILRERRTRGWFTVELRHFWEVWNACPRCDVSFSDRWL